MTDPAPRRKYNVGVTKIPPHRRTIAREVLPTTAAWERRGYVDVIGSDADDAAGLARHPYGSDAAYSVELTDAEADRFAAASNLRYLEEAEEHLPARAVGRPTGAAAVPTLATLGWLRARYVDLRRWHGRDVRVAVLDQGTTQAVRDAMGFTLIARTITSGVTLGPGQELVHPDHSHGCLVAPNAVPAGGLLLDAIISTTSGGTLDTYEAAAIRWAVDNGARVINLSFAGSPGTPTQVFQDACAYARDNGGVQIVISAGNDNLPDLASPSSASRLFAGVHSSIAFDESTDRRALFSNHHADASGCSSGVDVASFDIYGNPVLWDGTSASAPHTAHLMARALTGGQFTPAQVGVAFKANTRDTGAGADQQGGGAYDLHRALAALGAIPAPIAGVATPTHVDTRGGGSAGATAGWSLTPASGIQVDDMQIAVLVSSANAQLAVPHGWTVTLDLPYFGGWELGNGITVGPTRVRVLTKPYTADQPASVSANWGSTWFSGLVLMTVRCPGGLDPEWFSPLVQFGTSGSIATLSAQPATTSDLQVCVFAQRHPAATTATLSLPAGLTQRGFWRPSTGTTGYAVLAATRTLTDATRTPVYTSTSNDATGTWASLTLTIPGGAPALAPVTQVEPSGPPGSTTPFLPHA